MKFFNISLFILLAHLCYSQQEEVIISELKDILIPLAAKQSDENYDDLSGLKVHLSSKEIIGLGEGSHGTKEFFELKNRFIRFSIQHLDFTAVAYEADFIACEYINSYITGKADTLIYSGGFPHNGIMQDQFKWIREWNLNQQDSNKMVEVYGLEIRDYKKAVERIINVISVLSDEDISFLSPLMDKQTPQLSRKEVNSAVQVLEKLLKNEAVSRKEKETHYINLAIQSIQHQTNAAGRIKKNSYVGLRDGYIAGNLKWIRDHKGHRKILIWAHNGHLAKGSPFGKPSMGKYLSDYYKDKYYNIATTFGEGEVSLFIRNGKKYEYGTQYFARPKTADHYEYYFGLVDSLNYYVDVESALEKPALNTLLTDMRYMRMIGGTSDASSNTKLSIALQFDAIIFIDHSSGI